MPKKEHFEKPKNFEKKRKFSEKKEKNFRKKEEITKKKKNFQKKRKISKKKRKISKKKKNFGKKNENIYLTKIFSLGERVKQIIDRSAHLHIEWNPRDIYRQWVQKLETSTGIQTELKHDATIDEALKVREVREILTENISTLCTLVEGFLNAITGSASSLPYGLRYIARILYEALQEKFPEEKEEALLLPVGNLIYYRFLNPAICAPEAFDVIDLEINKG